MGEKLPYAADMKAEAMKALMANAPAVMELAEKICLSPDELRELVHEAILLHDGKISEQGMPVLAQPPGALKHLSPQDLRLLLGDYQPSKPH